MFNVDHIHENFNHIADIHEEEKQLTVEQ